VPLFVPSRWRRPELVDAEEEEIRTEAATSSFLS
jgi:hypothetical protein